MVIIDTLLEIWQYSNVYLIYFQGLVLTFDNIVIISIYPILFQDLVLSLNALLSL